MTGLVTCEGSTVSRPLVSVVIPTRGRPHLVTRAVCSALGQTVFGIEVIVVIDGSDEETSVALTALRDPRLRVVKLLEKQGGAEARNVGVRLGRAHWIAFLDDDDEWLPSKLEHQLAVAAASRHEYPVVASRFVARTPQGDYTWPTRLPRTEEPLSEYLFVRHRLFRGEGQLQTSTLIVPKQLLERVPFSPELKKHQDSDWALRALEHPGVGIEFLPQVLSIWRLDEPRGCISAGADWCYSMEWARNSRSRMTRRAYAAFLLTIVSSEAASRREWRAVLVLLKEAFRNGSPSTLDLILHCGMWIVPARFRQALRAFLLRAQKASAKPRPRRPWDGPTMSQPRTTESPARSVRQP